MASKASAIVSSPFSSVGGEGLVQLNNDPKRTLSQSRTIYFVSNDGNFQPYSRVTVRENPDDLFWRNSKNSDILNSDLVEKYTGPHYALKKFAKERKLKFTIQDDLVAVLHEYEAVLEEEGMK